MTGFQNGLPRAVIVNPEKCRPHKCAQECKVFCPQNQMSKLCVDVTPTSRITVISESLCTGCGQCARRCPFNAISVVNLPADLDTIPVIHSYGQNSFRLHRFPSPRAGEVHGLLGANGCGKTTVLKILAGALPPNLGHTDSSNPAPKKGSKKQVAAAAAASPPQRDQVDWAAVSKFFRGTSMQRYIALLARGQVRVAIKPQHIAALMRGGGERPDAVRKETEGGGGGAATTFREGEALATTTTTHPHPRSAMIVLTLLQESDERGVMDHLITRLELGAVLDRELGTLSGGEIQRVLIACTAAKMADMYIFDEPSTFLDIRQRVAVGKLIRELAQIRVTSAPEGVGDGGGGRDEQEPYVVIVDHDLIVLELAASSISLLYGAPPAYGTVSGSPMRARRAINAFLRGYIPSANLRFRDHALTFRIGMEASSSVALAAADVEEAEEEDHDKKKQKKKKEKQTTAAAATATTTITTTSLPLLPSFGSDGQSRPVPPATSRAVHCYPAMRKTLGTFVLDVEEGHFSPGGVVCMMGPNGCGKTTFLRLLAGRDAPDGDDTPVSNGDTPLPLLPHLRVSCKPQHLSGKSSGTVEALLDRRLGSGLWRVSDSAFASAVVRPLGVHHLVHQPVATLSGGELQRVALTLCLGQPADLYLIDEPSAHLDVEQRIAAASVIRRWVMQQTSACAFVVEHDLIFAAHLAARVIVHSGHPGVHCTASAPMNVPQGISELLRDLDITLRRDETGRPRVNRPGSTRDVEQKRASVFFALGEGEGV